MHHPTDRITHTTAFVTPAVEHWMEREIAQWVHPMKDRSDDPSHHERTLLPRSYIPVTKLHNNVLRTYTELYTCYFLFLFIAQVYFALEYIIIWNFTYFFFFIPIYCSSLFCARIYIQNFTLFFIPIYCTGLFCARIYIQNFTLFCIPIYCTSLFCARIHIQNFKYVIFYSYNGTFL